MVKWDFLSRLNSQIYNTSKVIVCAIIYFVVILKPSLAQVPVDLSEFDNEGDTQVNLEGNTLDVSWLTDSENHGYLTLNLQPGSALIQSIKLDVPGGLQEIAADLDPTFLLTVGQRNLERNDWTVFFDYPAYRPHESYVITPEKESVKVVSEGSRTYISIDGVEAGSFSGSIDLTIFNGSPLINVAADISSDMDSLAIIYDAGLVSKGEVWEDIFWADPQNYTQSTKVEPGAESENLAVKYRTIIGESKGGSIAVFPPPHQYFYPLDNAYNLKHTWHGTNYRGLISDYGIGIRHELLGDRRHVPWFNAPPGTNQRLNFFCLLSADKDGMVLEKVKQFTNEDTYKPLPGYKTLASHFHTEHIDDILTHKPLPDIPGHVKVMKDMGVNIMHQGEFHLAGNPRDPGPRRLPELQLMFEEFARLSTGDFLMLPGEEPNVHFGGHWMNIFPEPVYWMMSREPDEPFVEEHPDYGKIYRVGNKEEMLKLLEVEDGLAWTAHPRIKGSIGYPDNYSDQDFYLSDHFLGAAWKAMPADLSHDELGSRVLDLMDDMANWGQKKYVLAEADLFKLEPEYEVYGPMNVNYIQLDKLPDFENGWSSVLDVIRRGKFFSTTGEILLPEFTVNGKGPGETLNLNGDDEAIINLNVQWTFPLNYLEIISGDGNQVYKEKVTLHDTQSFGDRNFELSSSLEGRNWVRVEVWDVAANGAYTQFVWLE